MHIERFDPAADSARLRACYRDDGVRQARGRPERPADVAARAFTGWWGIGWNSDPRETWLATDHGGEPTGCYLLELPELDNTKAGGLLPVVALPGGARVIGRALLRPRRRARGPGRAHAAVG